MLLSHFLSGVFMNKRFILLFSCTIMSLNAELVTKRITEQKEALEQQKTQKKISTGTVDNLSQEKAVSHSPEAALHKEQGPQLVISQKKKRLPSTSKLKEELGQVTRDTLFTANNLLRRLSSVHFLSAQLFEQQEELKRPLHFSPQQLQRSFGQSTDSLAQLYERLSLLIEELLNNDKNIKKAKRQELFDAVTEIKKIDAELSTCFIQKESKALTNNYLAEETKKITSGLAVLNAIPLVPRST